MKIVDSNESYFSSGSLFHDIIILGGGAHGSVVGCGTVLQAGMSRVRFPNQVIGFFNLPNPSSRTMTLGVDSASNRNEYQEYSWG
jgi:hypothetical protein